MTWYNPMTWFRTAPTDLLPLKDASSLPEAPPEPPPPPPPEVYVRLELDRPFHALSVTEPVKKPWIRIRGLTLLEAAAALPGKSLAWHLIPMTLREALEREPGHFDIAWADIQPWVI